MLSHQFLWLVVFLPNTSWSLEIFLSFRCMWMLLLYTPVSISHITAFIFISYSCPSFLIINILRQIVNLAKFRLLQSRLDVCCLLNLSICCVELNFTFLRKASLWDIQPFFTLPVRTFCPFPVLSAFYPLVLCQRSTVLPSFQAWAHRAALRSSPVWRFTLASAAVTAMATLLLIS